MAKTLNGRPYTTEKTGIDDLEKLKEVRESLISQSGKDRLQERARNRRQFTPNILSTPLIVQPLKPSDTPYQVLGYNPDSDSWQVQSLSNPSDQFSATAIKAGGIAIGSTVRGYAPVAIEQKPQGRRFKPIEEPITQTKLTVITIKIGYTGRV